MRDFAFLHSKLCVCLCGYYVRFLYMVGSATFYWKEALIVAVNPISIDVGTGPLESLYAELFTHMASYTMASPRLHY